MPLVSSLYTRRMVGASSAAENVAPSYRISLVRAGDGSDSPWLAEVDDLPGASARGASPEEAVQRAWSAAEKTLGLAGPRAKDAGRSKQAAGHSGRILVRMPATLHDELAHAAEREGVSLNQLITGVLAGAVEWGGDAERIRLRDDAAQSGGTGRGTRIALVANFVVVLIAAIAAIALLVIAINGW